MINLSQIPPWCLHDTISKLPEDKISLLAQTNSAISAVCQSESIWKGLYTERFPTVAFKVKSHTSDIKWLDLYAARQSIGPNLATKKAKAKSFRGENIKSIRTKANSFAYNSPNTITLVIYDYNNSSCDYQQLQTYQVPNNDFLIQNTSTIIGVEADVVHQIDIETSSMNNFNVDIGNSPAICPIDEHCFAAVSEGKGIILDTREACDQRCVFPHKSDIIELASNGSSLFIASSKDLSAHDIRNPRGPILWNSVSSQLVTFASFNTKSGYALFGKHIIKLSTGAVVYQIDVEGMKCGTVVNNHMCIVAGDNGAGAFYDFIQDKKGALPPHSEKEKISCISASHLNDRVAVAGEKNIRIYHAEYDQKELKVVEVKNSFTGAPSQREFGHFSAGSQIVFDGERLIVNFGSFVRVYDYYSRRTGAK